MKGCDAMNALLLTALGLVLASSAASAQTPVPPAMEPPVVIVHGDGVVRKAPDQAFVRIGAESRARNPKEAQAANAEAMSGVQQKLAAAGLAKDAARTVIVSLQQEFDYKDGRQTPRGYVARNIIEVRVDDLAKLGDVMDASVGSGATSIHGLRFDLKERAAAEREALTLAVADAMARANAAASGARRTVERVVRIDEAPLGQFPPQSFAAPRMMAADAAPQTTPVAEGELEIRAQVTLTAVIK
jgi:uncharacterized protein YggE